MRNDLPFPCPKAKGSALMLMLIILGLATALLVSALKSNPQIERDKITADALAKAKDALIGYAVSRTASNPRPGDLRRPDVASSSETPPNYDGTSDGGCMDVSTPGGLPLIGSSENMRCLGRLPWVELGISYGDTPENDPAGLMPWYAISANLIDPTCLAILNSDTVTLPAPTVTNNTYTLSCASSSQLPHPWLTIRDEKGNVISNRVAAVIIIPGPPLAGQTRPASPNLAGPAAYLDSITVSGITYSNADLDNDFIQASPSGTFNDKLLFITIDELIAAVEKRVAAEAGNALKTFYDTCGFYPKPVDFLNSSCYTGTCTSDTSKMQGRFPFSPKPAFATSYPGWTLPPWFGDNRWDAVIYYAISNSFKSGGDSTTPLIVDGSPSARALFFTPAATLINRTTGTAPTTLANYLLTAENTNGDATFIFNNTKEKGYQRKNDPSASGYTPSAPNPICGCPSGQSIPWTVGSANCSATTSAGFDTKTITLNSTATGTTGSATAICNVGIWQVSSSPSPTCTGAGVGTVVSFSDPSKFSKFEIAGVGVTVDPANQTATIDVAGGSGGGCFWFPDTMTLNGKILRSYYEFKFTYPDPPGGSDYGYGFTLSFLQGDAGKPTKCGSQSTMGVIPASTIPFSLFVETDISRESSNGEPSGTPNHTAIMANGNIVHSATNGNLTAACNGAAAGCNHSPSNKFEESPTTLLHNQRVEIHSGYNSTCTATGGTYSLVKVWVDCIACNDTATNFSSFPTVTRCISLDSSMNNIYFGFTAGFASSGGQVQGVTLQKLELRVE